MEEKKKFKGINRVIIAIAIITCLLIGANVYASTAGYGNIFFMIRNLFTHEEVQGGDNLLSDRDITVSYSSIEIAEGLNVQIQRVTLEDNLTTIYVHVDKDTVSLNENPLRYKVYDESNNLLAEYTNNRSIVECVFTDAIKINQKVSENAKLRLEIYASSGKKLSNITIDLANKELLVDGEKVEKLSEIELKKYLGVFATLSEFKDEKNQPDYLIVVAEELNDRILHNPSFKSDYYYLQRELTDNIVKSFYWNDDIDLVDLLDKYADENGIRYDKSKDVYIHDDELGILTGECINISNISYKDNVYTIDFTFYSYYDLQDGANIEDVTHYEATIQLKYNPNSEYSKYKIVSISKPLLITKPTTDTNKDTKQNTESINVKTEYKFDYDIDEKILDKFWINNNNVIDSMFDKTNYKHLQLLSKEVSNNLVFANILLYGTQNDETYLFIYNNNGELIKCFYTLNDVNYDNNEYNYNGKFEYDSNNNILTFNTRIWLGEGEEQTGVAFNDKHLPDLSKKELERLLNYAYEVRYEYKYGNGKFELIKKTALSQLKDNEYYRELIQEISQ